MTTTREQNLEFGRRWSELWNERDPAFWELLGPGAPVHTGRTTYSREQGRAGDAHLLRALPDCLRQIVRETADDEHFIHHWRCSGHLASDRRLVEWEGCTWARVQDSLIVEAWIFADPSEPKLE